MATTMLPHSLRPDFECEREGAGCVSNTGSRWVDKRNLVTCTVYQFDELMPVVLCLTRSPVLYRTCAGRVIL